MTIAGLLGNVLYLYSLIIIVYALLSWVPAGGFVDDVRRVLGTLCDPYLSIFRRFIPPIGMIDISAMVGILVLWAARSAIVTMLPY